MEANWFRAPGTTARLESGYARPERHVFLGSRATLSVGGKKLNIIFWRIGRASERVLRICAPKTVLQPSRIINESTSTIVGVAGVVEAAVARNCISRSVVVRANLFVLDNKSGIVYYNTHTIGTWARGFRHPFSASDSKRKWSNKRKLYT